MNEANPHPPGIQPNTALEDIRKAERLRAHARDQTNADAEVERVARAFCQNLGLDPDAPVIVAEVQKFAEGSEEGEPVLPVPMGGGRVWQTYAQQAREAIAMHRAIAQALPSR
jgi:hypothetical protein